MTEFKPHWIVRIKDKCFRYSSLWPITEIYVELLKRGFVFGIKEADIPTDYGWISRWIVNEKGKKIGQIEMITKEVQNGVSEQL